MVTVEYHFDTNWRLSEWKTIFILIIKNNQGNSDYIDLD